MVDLARTASKSKVEALPISERVEVLQIRLMLTPSELRKITGRECYIRAVDKGWNGSTSSLECEKVTVNKDRATLIYGIRIPGPEHRLLHLRGRCMEGRPSPADDDQALRTMARENGMSEQEFVIEILKAVSGREEIPDSIWSPSR